MYAIYSDDSATNEGSFDGGCLLENVGGWTLVEVVSMDRTNPALSIHEHCNGWCITVSDAMSNFTWYWGDTLPEFRSMINATLRAWRGDLPRCMPTLDHDFHLWNGRHAWSSEIRTYARHPNRVLWWMLQLTVVLENLWSGVSFSLSLGFGVLFHSSFTILRA